MVRCTTLAAVPLALAGTFLVCGQPESREGEDAEDVLVRVERVAVDENDVPVVILEEEGGERWLPIWIGSAEAQSIALEMGSHRLPRPNTHDLARRLIQGLDGEVDRVVVTELRDGTYYAILALRTRGRVVEIDSRPSDAIAIALRAGARIFVRAALFMNHGEPGQPSQPGRQVRSPDAIDAQPGGNAGATPSLSL